MKTARIADYLLDAPSMAKSHTLTTTVPHLRQKALIQSWWLVRYSKILVVIALKKRSNEGDEDCNARTSTP